MSERLAIRILIGLGIIVLGLWVAHEMLDLLQLFSTVLALFFTAWLISFVLSPPTDGLVRLGARRPLAVFAVYFLVITGLVLGSVLLTPLLAAQLGQLLETVNSYTAQTPGMLTWAEGQARALGLSEADLRDFYGSIVDQVRAITGLVLQNALTWLTGAATLMVNIAFCLIISIYIMLDGRRILAGVLGLVPRHYRGEVEYVFQSIEVNFGGFIRGQLILAVIYALSVAGVMAVTGLDYKIICAIFAGVAMMIPFVGPFISVIPPILVAIFFNADRVWWVIILLIVVQQVVLNAVAPRVFGHTVNMHPLLVIAAAMSGAAVAGVWGALFGIPVAGIIASVVKRLYTLQQQRDAAQDIPAPPPPSPVEVGVPVSTARDA